MSADLSASHINTSWGGWVVKGVQRDFPLAGVWGCPPAILPPPLLEERGVGGEVNKRWGWAKAYPEIGVLGDR